MTNIPVLVRVALPRRFPNVY